MDKSKLAFASSISAVITVLYITGITIYGEVSLPFKALLKSISGHHWTTKSLSSVALYIILLLIFYALQRESPSSSKVNRAVWKLFAVSILGFVAILLFFSLHYLRA